MSGIAAIIHFDGRPVGPGEIELMTNSIAYRGPDGIRHWQSARVALGHCMLQTTAESLEERQPLANEDASLVMVMDGRVDNWEELRKQLLGLGARLRNRSDAELVLRAYEIWGQECLSNIDGDFSLVVWDVRRQLAFCARDRMGNKPFRYFFDGKSLVVASESRAILALPWMTATANTGMLAEYLAGEWHSRHETLWSEVLNLVPAHRMAVTAQGAVVSRYWQPELQEDSVLTSDAEHIEHYRFLLSDSVRRASRSFQRIACEVSGGLDSTAVFGLAQNMLAAKKLGAPGVDGYSLAFPDGTAAYELDYCRAAGDFLGVRIHEVRPSQLPSGWFAESARNIREFPGFPNAAMFMGLRQQAAANGARVLLTGEGGDEWLTGSRAYYAEELASGRMASLFHCFREDARALGVRRATRLFLRQGLFPLLPQAIQSTLRQAYGSGSAPAARATYWLSRPMQALLDSRRQRTPELAEIPARRLGQDELSRTLNDAFSELVMDNSETIGARAGLEMRYPLRSTAIVQFAFSTPSRLRLRGDQEKFIHVQALKGVLPELILGRKSKAEFSVVVRSLLDDLEARLTNSIPQDHPEWLDHGGVSRLFQDYKSNPTQGWQTWILWSIYACDRLFPPDSSQ